MKTISKYQLLELFDKHYLRLPLLEQKDRTFISVFRATENFRQLAMLASVHEATVARRLKKIAARLADDGLMRKIYAAKHSAIAKDYLLNKKNIKQLAEKYKYSRRQIREIIADIKVENVERNIKNADNTYCR